MSVVIFEREDGTTVAIGKPSWRPAAPVAQTELEKTIDRLKKLQLRIAEARLSIPEAERHFAVPKDS